MREGFRMFCPNCGSQTSDGANNCSNCGASLNANNVQQTTGNYQPNNMNNNGGEQKSKLAAGLFGIFLGAFGVHDFYLGNVRNGVIKLCLTLIGWILCGLGPIAAQIWGLVDGILVLAGKVTTDANGVPLKD